MRYYKITNADDTLIGIGTGSGGTEISEAEYHERLAIIREKADYAFRLCAGEITAEDVPEIWREEVQKMAADMVAPEPEQMSETEEKANAYDILMGVSE